MPKYSIIIPVYNRPDEIDELLESLTHQSYTDFEVIVVEDGSTLTCKEVTERHQQALTISYYFKENSGQGFSRNYGFDRAIGDWLLVFDSDCLIPKDYLKIVDAYITKHSIDAYGGPDRSHDSFTAVQKAISYSMTSLFTTGGIRGRKKHVGVFHPRSFNMGISREVYERTGGYQLPKKGEDIEFSIRIIAQGFRTALIDEAYVYHKRRTSFRQFFRQLHFFGTARINVFRFYRSELRLVHFFPAVFTLGLTLGLLGSTWWWGRLILGFYALYSLLLLSDAFLSTKNLKVTIYSLCAAYIQLIAYGLGFVQEGFIYLKRK